ncbi:MAG: OmpH family outer membrane protein [Myxococcota bacterium]
MHRSLAIAFLGIALIIGGVVSADANPGGSFKIGVIDFDKILTETAAGKRASQQFEKELKTKQQQLDKKQQDLQKYAVELEKQASVLKPDVVRKRQQELQKRYVELQQTYVTLERELAERRTRLITEIVKKARPIITDIAKKEGYDMIVDRSVVVWSDNTYNLTNKVKARIK